MNYQRKEGMSSTQQVQKSELCFLVLGFLKDFKFKTSYETFHKECDQIVRTLKRVAGRPVKSLEAILNEYIHMKQQEVHKQQLLSVFGQQPALANTLKNMNTLLDDYMTLRNTYMPPPSVSNTMMNNTTTQAQKAKSTKQNINNTISTSNINNINNNNYSSNMYNTFDTNNNNNNNTTAITSNNVHTSDEYNTLSPTMDTTYNQNTFYEGANTTDINKTFSTNQNTYYEATSSNITDINPTNTNDVTSQNKTSTTNDQLLLATANTNLNMFNTTSTSTVPLAKSPGVKLIDTPKRKSLTPRKITFADNSTNHTYKANDNNDDVLEIFNFGGGGGTGGGGGGGEAGGEEDGGMDLDTIVKFLGGEGVRALMNNTELHEKIAEHINTYLPPSETQAEIEAPNTTTTSTTTSTSSLPPSFTPLPPSSTSSSSHDLPEGTALPLNQASDEISLQPNDTVLQQELIHNIVDSIEHDPAFDAFFTTFIDLPANQTKTKSPNSNNKTKTATPRKLPYPPTTTTICSPHRSPLFPSPPKAIPIPSSTTSPPTPSSTSPSPVTSPFSAASSRNNNNINNYINNNNDAKEEMTSNEEEEKRKNDDGNEMTEEERKETTSSRKRKLEYGDQTTIKKMDQERGEAAEPTIDDVDSFLSALKYD